MKRALTHDEALDAIAGTLGVTVLSYQEAIESYLMLRRLESVFTSLANASAIEARSDATVKQGAAEGESAAPSGETPND